MSIQWDPTCNWPHNIILGFLLITPRPQTDEEGKGVRYLGFTSSRRGVGVNANRINRFAELNRAHPTTAMTMPTSLPLVITQSRWSASITQIIDPVFRVSELTTQQILSQCCARREKGSGTFDLSKAADCTVHARWTSLRV